MPPVGSFRRGAGPRYRFGPFVVSPTRRTLTRDGTTVPLIPRYFDLLALLVERRGEALHRNEIMDTVWADVVVSDGALSQAIRVLRRVLGDDPRAPTFIRTVQRHGYQFVFPDVVEEAEPSNRTLGSGRDAPNAGAAVVATNPGLADEHPLSEMDDLVARVLDGGTDVDARRDAAERLHTLGIEKALARLGRRPGHVTARALLREVRWDVPDARPVPILGQPAAGRTAAALLAARGRRVWRLAGSRWLTAVGAASLAGLIAGLLGALVLHYGPGSTATDVVFVALPLVGVVVGNLGAVGVAAGLSSAEVLFRSMRSVALVIGGAAGGGLVGATAHLIGRMALEGMFGGDLTPVAGGFEGVVIGGCVGLGYAVSTRMPGGGMAAPRGWSRVRVAIVGGLVCAAGTALMGLSGRYLGAMSLDLLAQTFPASQVGLGPLARLLGEADVGPLTRALVSGFEGLLFGAGLVAGLTTRPRSF